MNSLARFFCVPLFMMIIISLSPSIAQAQDVHVVDTILTMTDGVKLDAFYVLPVSLPPSGGYPAILYIHGFSGNKNNNRSLAVTLARQGYAGVAYSVRGQGKSGGEFDFFTSKNLRSDLQAMINFTKSLPGVNPDRVAAHGASQGGIHAWMAAAYHMGVRAVVSIVANGRFEEDWAMNNAVNWLFATTLMTDKVRFAPLVRDTIRQAIKDDNFSFIRSKLEEFSTTRLEKGVITPTLMLVSYYDQYFNPSSALRQFHNISAPRRIVLWPAGHSAPSDPSQMAYINDVTERWLRYWLKDDTSVESVASPDSAVVMFNATTGKPHVYSLSNSGAWLYPTDPLPFKFHRIRLYISGDGLLRRPPTKSGYLLTSYLRGLGSNALSLPLGTFPGPMFIAGTMGKAHLVTNGLGSTYQINLLLFDKQGDGSSKPVTRAHYQVRNNDRSTRDVLEFDLNTAVHTIFFQHTLELNITGGMGLLPNPSFDFGNAVLGPYVNSIDTIFYGGDNMSYIDVYIYDLTTPDIIPVPKSITLYQNFPNPFSASTVIQFGLEKPDHVTLSVFDLMGRKVRTIFDGKLDKRLYLFRFEPGNLPGGVYMYQLRTSTAVLTKMMTLRR
ncbi:MAG: alpha/beta fold hydrolase [Chlorobi bacterium]|nr:alpha/beta fold hydrolase [Chlorobiota bacterium]